MPPMSTAQRSPRLDRRLIRLVAVAGIAVAIGLAWWVLAPALTMASVVEHGTSLRHAVHQHLPVAIGIGTLLYVLVSLIPGTTGKSLVYGWLFGFWIAIGIVCISLTIAAVISMITVRHFFQDWATRQAPRTIARINAALRRGGEATCLLMLRVLHSPYTLTNYSAGATEVRLSTFAWTTLVGMIPGNLIFVMVGSRLSTLDDLSSINIWAAADWRLLLVSSLAIVIPTLLQRWIVTRDGEDLSPEEDAGASAGMHP